MLAALSMPDTIVVVICALLAVRGAFKGFAWTVVRVLGFIAAIGAGILGHEALGAWIDSKVPAIPDTAADVVAFAVIVVVVWLLATYLAWIARGAVRRVKLGGIDRPLGFVAGGALGLLFLTVVFLVLGRLFPSWMGEKLEDSVTAPYMRMVVETVEGALPDDIRDHWQGILDGLDGVGEKLIDGSSD